jgi:acid phosphatase (class A)
MRRSSRLALIASAGGVVVIVATAALLLATPNRRVHLDASEAPTPSTSAPAGQDGYLAAGVVDSASIVPPPPAPGSPRADADRKVFLATRALEGSPRWALAASDNDQSIGATLDDFTLDAASAPATVQLFARLIPDAARTVNTAKHHFNRKRPFLLDPGPICTLKTDELAKSPDYPSGHASWAWIAALMFAEIAPDHATQVLARGRAYGESRVVCGVHTPSAVEAGRVNGAALVAALHSSGAFRADLDLARAELSSLRAAGRAPDAGKCQAQAELIAKPAY